MMKASFSGGAAATLLVLLTLAAGCRPLDVAFDDSEAFSGRTSSSDAGAAETHPSFLYGRITTVGGDTYEGRLRFGGDEEAFWGDYFNGFKDGNPWLAHLPSEDLPKERRTIRFLGLKITGGGAHPDLRRPFMARFGDIARLEARGRDLTVTLKSGTEVELDRWSADDYADGVRVWDGRRGLVTLDERQVRSIEFLHPPRPDETAPNRLHGTVRAREGEFTGFLEWNRDGSVGLDDLAGHTRDGDRLNLPFATIGSIERRSPESSLVTLLDGTEVVLSGTSHVGEGNRGIYVDDPRYGRVLISWDAFDRVDFSAAGDSRGESGPAYDAFPTGRPLMGTVTTRDGRRLAGRLVYDLDEGETIETLDAPSRGVHYTIPFGLVASIELTGRGGRAAGRATVTLHSGEELRLERSGDLGAGNAGMLIFGEGRKGAEYVSWADVERVELDRPAAMYPAVAWR